MVQWFTTNPRSFLRNIETRIGIIRKFSAIALGFKFMLKHPEQWGVVLKRFQVSELHKKKDVLVGLWWVPLVAALIPFLGVHFSYAVSVINDHVPLCVPYWDSCTSISRTGRTLPEKVLFKLFMMPSAMLGLAFWWCLGAFLHNRFNGGRLYFFLGLVANVFLMIYVAALGEVGDSYRTMRRVGVILFFSLTLFMQLWFIRDFRRCILPGYPALRGVYRFQYTLILLAFVIGIGSVVLAYVYPGYDQIEDAIEWQLAILINLHFLSHARLWHKLELGCMVTVKNKQPSA